jgi:hypothetical protein
MKQRFYMDQGTRSPKIVLWLLLQFRQILLSLRTDLCAGLLIHPFLDQTGSTKTHLAFLFQSSAAFATSSALFLSHCFPVKFQFFNAFFSFIDGTVNFVEKN